MNRKITRLLAVVFAVVMIFSLTACTESSEDAVSVQSVAMITGVGSVGRVNRYAGMVVSGSTEEIKLDESMTLDEVFVEEGQDVAAGDVLFTYNNEALLLTLEQGKLEIEGMKNSVAAYKTQISELEKERSKVPDANKLQYTLEIQGLQADIRETEYNISVKEKEIAAQTALSADTEVKASLTGRVISVDSSGGTDNYGNPKPFITIVETGNLRIKGTINEMNRDSLYEGASVIIHSRIDSSVTWNGIIDSIDWENQEQNNSNNYYYYGYDSGSDMTTSSKYPFYVSIDDYEGLFMGQHVYIEPGEVSGDDGTELKLPAYFINDADSDPWVWAANSRDKLEKRKVTLGAYNSLDDEYVVESGLTPEDYIAFPDETLKAGAPVVKYDENSFTDDTHSGGFDDGGKFNGYDMVIPEGNADDTMPEGGMTGSDLEFGGEETAEPGADDSIGR